GSFCDPIWDGVMCWNSAKENTVVKQRCPEYINGLMKKGVASKRCMENGSWFFSFTFNKTWTDYTDCLPKDSLMEEHLPRIRLMYNIGYGISLCTLVIAVFIMLCTRKLHSKSNTLHINLFLAFIFRASMSFLKETLFVNGIGLEKDLIQTPGQRIKFNEEGTHWECKLLYTVFIYTLSASLMWIFMEALYLYMLVYKTLFTERNGVLMYILIGWLGPLTFIIPWVVVRAKLEDELKLAKFIVVLWPLFGITYIIFSFFSTNELNAERDVPLLYAEMFYNSFQVLMTFKKLWNRYAMRRKDSFVYTRSAVLTSRQTSRHPFFNEASSEYSTHNRSFHSQGVKNDSLLLKSHKQKHNSCPIPCKVMNSSTSDFGSGGNSYQRQGTCAETNCTFLTIHKGGS
ncbi:hypothetical protein FSP39_021763, partial [Pinctada imbricata]